MRLCVEILNSQLVVWWSIFHPLKLSTIVSKGISWKVATEPDLVPHQVYGQEEHPDAQV